MKAIAVMLALAAAPSAALCQQWSPERCATALLHAYSPFSARQRADASGDFNGGGQTDVALLLDNTHDAHKSAIGVCLSGESRPLLITAPYASARIFTKSKGTAYTELETGKPGVYEKDAISVSDGAEAGASSVLRVGVFARVVDGN